jgi:hypothetical protein
MLIFCAASACCFVLPLDLKRSYSDLIKQEGSAIFFKA